MYAAFLKKKGNNETKTVRNLKYFLQSAKNPFVRSLLIDIKWQKLMKFYFIPNISKTVNMVAKIWLGS